MTSVFSLSLLMLSVSATAQTAHFNGNHAIERSKTGTTFSFIIKDAPDTENATIILEKLKHDRGIRKLNAIISKSGAIVVPAETCKNQDCHKLQQALEFAGVNTFTLSGQKHTISNLSNVLATK